MAPAQSSGAGIEAMATPSALRPSARAASSAKGERTVSRPDASARGQKSAADLRAEESARWNRSGSAELALSRKTFRRAARLTDRRSSSESSGSTAGRAGSSPSTSPITRR